MFYVFAYYNLHSTIFILKLGVLGGVLSYFLGFTFYNIYIKTRIEYMIAKAYGNLHSTIFILKLWSIMESYLWK